MKQTSKGDNEGLRKLVQNVSKRSLEEKKEKRKENNEIIGVLQEKIRKREKGIKELNRSVQEALTEIKKENWCAARENKKERKGNKGAEQISAGGADRNKERKRRNGRRAEAA
ncbi:hypothetical protein QE152_g11241 [Popillia japonica]|uniref:Uncharacterized protein n=1 Tax=Popillia japonica TaxID=7064 RepID=A0AAW1LS37_POPJA